MPTIEELLRKSLEGATPEYERADQDLHAEVREASAAVQRLTDALAKLVLVPEGDQEGATVYRLALAFGEEHRTLKAIAIPQLGYPIYHDTSVRALREDPRRNVCSSREELHDLFAQLASDRKSPLVSLVAFIRRNKAALTAPVGDATL